MDKVKYFLEIMHKAEARYGSENKRLAGEGWKHGWQTLIATILSAQTRDEVTLPIAEKLFRKYSTLEDLADAKYADVIKIIRSINYNRTKSRNVIAAAKFIIKEFDGKLPKTIDQLVMIPGVGRKTANLVLSEVHSKDSITIDTHCHRLLNVLGLVNAKNPTETELQVMKIAPRRYWSRINRLFVLWGKDVKGYDKKKILSKLEEA